MVTIHRTPQFASWFRALRDARAIAKIALRIDRLGLGNAGDSKSVGGGVREMRIDYGPGYRVYFAAKGSVLILLLCGGTKNSQQADIAQAKQLFAEWKSEQR